MLDDRTRSVVRTIWQFGPQSRWELHQRLGISPNAAGDAVGQLMQNAILAELPAPTAKSGRPRVPLAIDINRKHLVGVAIAPGEIEMVRCNLLGEALEPAIKVATKRSDDLVQLAAKVLGEAVGRTCLAVGLSLPGFIDASARTILMSAAIPGKKNIPLEPILKAAKKLPLVVENDMHALAARWLLSQTALGGQQDAQQDVLLVQIDDGRLGAAVLINGRPNSGCAMGGNELGHFRFMAPTEACYCGQTGCLERIVSTSFVNVDVPRTMNATLAALTHQHGSQQKLPSKLKGGYEFMFDHLVCALSNAVNFLRPHQLVIVSPLPRSEDFNEDLVSQIKARLLAALSPRVRISFWEEPALAPAQNAACLALADLVLGGWQSL
jgi:predicted NBD/HSP70 family sugar kinase